MSDLPSSDPTPESAAIPVGEQELEVDLAAFLPEGVQFGDPGEAADEDVEVEVDVVETVLATDDGVVVIDEIEAVVATDDGVVVIDEVLVDGQVVAETVVEEAVIEAPAAEAAPGVDLEALSQIERDLDAVDAAIAALDAGTYGIDQASGRPIDDALLAEDPTRLS